MIADHVSVPDMERIPVSKFKATCLALVQRVKRTGRPVTITRFGEPVAEVVPARRRASRSGWLGAMAGRAKIAGDVVGPPGRRGEWAAMRR
ncbi:MAG: type II toxin-antitoxin system Phd/YefM family antitoxin [Burkholderiales bacterium]|nr:type II toxin-antitoxin system Phd/YefM family antitoxin [Burkholderiales bacterium]